VAPDTWEDSLADYHRLTSPVDGRVLGQWGDGATDLVEQAYIHARGAASELGELGTAARCELLDETASHLTKLADDAMVPQLVLEHGKTVAEYRAELRSAAHGLSEAADYARKLEPELFAMATPGTHAEVERVGLGVVAAITPWNFPSNCQMLWTGSPCQAATGPVSVAPGSLSADLLSCNLPSMKVAPARTRGTSSGAAILCQRAWAESSNL
jgi:acyl-CoA reductase-like NAD-dependent aldehyde dehydrogenase